jgi:hypothetical protein
MGRRAKIAAAAVAVLALGAPAAAQTRSYLVTVDPVRKPRGFEKVRISKAALGSSEIRLWANAAIDPDCTEHPPGATLAILKPPAHGTARIANGPMYMAFPPNNPRSACNDRKVPGHEALYAANPGFTGRDRVVLQGSGPEGRVREITVDIDVR